LEYQVQSLAAVVVVHTDHWQIEVELAAQVVEQVELETQQQVQQVQTQQPQQVQAAVALVTHPSRHLLAATAQVVS
jgi:hypothetical protein